MQKSVCYVNIYCGVLLMTVVVGFHRDVVSCELAWRAVRRGAVEVSGSGGVQRVWAWLRGRFDVDRQSRLCTCLLIMAVSRREICREISCFSDVGDADRLGVRTFAPGHLLTLPKKTPRLRLGFEVWA